jgi:hypothetical protein
MGFILLVVGRGCRVRLDADGYAWETAFPPAFLPGSGLPGALIRIGVFDRSEIKDRELLPS